MKCLIHIRNEVYCTLAGLKKEHLDKLWEDFSPYVDGYQFMINYKLGRFNGRISFIEKTGKTYVRLISRILPYLANWGYEVELEDDRICFDQPGFITGDIFADRGIHMREYQVRAVNLCIETGSGFCHLPTGSGKSLVTAALSFAYSNAGHNSITIVPSGDLVEQTYEWYDRCGLDVGIYCGDKKELDHTNIVATWQSLQYNPKLLQSFNCVIWDESHGCAAQVAAKLLNQDGSHIPFKFGVTGTFPKGLANSMSLYSSIGEILIHISTKWMIDNGYLADVEIEQFVLKENIENFPDYESEKVYLSKANHRIDVIADLIITKCAEFGNTLVLVNSIKFGERLASLIEGAVFLYGANTKAERKEQYDLFAESDNLIVIATSKIASTGISIDRIMCLTIVDATKSFITTIQSIGRGTRLAHDKKKVHVVDVFSNLKWAKKHANERKKWYDEAEYPIIAKHIINL